MKQDFIDKVLAYHSQGRPGKLGIELTKPADNQDELSMAYSPGVAIPVAEILKDPKTAYDYTDKGNLVGIISNGTAVLGLGNVGALASKPVMEGKSMLFKRFANIDAFDIEVDCSTEQDFINTVLRIAPTFGAINLEDIKAPECFVIADALETKLTIPIMHDDQQGTAVVVAAGLVNALELVNKSLGNIKIVCSGAGAAGIAILKLLINLGAKKDNIYLLDTKGLVTLDRQDLNPYKFAFAQDKKSLDLAEVIKDADFFIGVSVGDLLSPDMLKAMAANPIVFALSNPYPEIKPELAKATRSDVIIATGRSDYPNQVNNVLAFPYIFRGALDIRATAITQNMLIAAVKAISQLAKEPVPEEVLAAYGNGSKELLTFGRNYILPTIFDPRLKNTVSGAVAKAGAINSY